MQNSQTSELEPTVDHIRDDADGSFSREDVASLPYQLWSQRDGESGSPAEDWFEAERLLHSAATNA